MRFDGTNRFVLSEDSCDHPNGEFVICCFDSWAEAEMAFESNGIVARLPLGRKLYDKETGRTWWEGSKYNWEDAQT